MPSGRTLYIMLCSPPCTPLQSHLELPGTWGYTRHDACDRVVETISKAFTVPTTERFQRPTVNIILTNSTRVSNWKRTPEKIEIFYTRSIAIRCSRVIKNTNHSSKIGIMNDYENMIFVRYCRIRVLVLNDSEYGKNTFCCKIEENLPMFGENPLLKTNVESSRHFLRSNHKFSLSSLLKIQIILFYNWVYAQKLKHHFCTLLLHVSIRVIILYVFE